MKINYLTSNPFKFESLFIPNGYDIPLGSMTDENQATFWQQEGNNWQKLLDYLAKIPDLQSINKPRDT